MTGKAPILYFGKVLQYSGKMKLMIQMNSKVAIEFVLPMTEWPEYCFMP